MSRSTKVVWVAGGSKGIGLAIAKRFYLSGYRVVMAARNAGSIADIQQQWLQQSDQETGGELLTVSVDARDSQAVSMAVTQVVNSWPQIDVLINSIGGIEQTGRFEDLSASDWLGCLELNILSMVNFCRACHPFLAQAARARVVNLTSITGVEPGNFNPHYSAAKAATINLSKHLANIWAEDDIMVNSIAAGPLDSNALHEIIKEKANQQERRTDEVAEEFIGGLASGIPLGRLGDTSDIAALVEFLASDRANWITGANICIDGGKHRGIL